MWVVRFWRATLGQFSRALKQIQEMASTEKFKRFPFRELKGRFSVAARRDQDALRTFVLQRAEQISYGTDPNRWLG